MNSLLELKNKSGRPIHKQELRRLTQMVLLQAHEKDEGGVDEGWKAKATSLLSALASLLAKVAASVKSDPDVWEIYAYFMYNIGRREEYFEIRLKQVFYSIPYIQKIILLRTYYITSCILVSSSP